MLWAFAFAPFRLEAHSFGLLKTLLQIIWCFLKMHCFSRKSRFISASFDEIRYF